MDITVTTHVYYLSPAYLLIIVVLVGFIYQLIRNQEYKNTLLSSTIIGIIITLLLVPFTDLVYFFLRMGIFVVLVLLGGFLAVGFKKLRMINEMETFHELTENESEDQRKWWSGQSPRSQSIIICSASLLSIILIINTICFLDPIENSVELEIHSIPDGLKDMNYTDNGETIFIIAKNSTQYALKGSSEAGAIVTITSGDLGIYNQTLPLDAENKYAYNLNIPSNVSNIKITLEATKPEKKDKTINFFIKKQ